MDYSQITNKLIARICEYFSENRLPGLGRIRITKLIYLVECEYLGWAENKLTDLDWIFYHYGPWSPMLDYTLNKKFNAPEEVETKLGTFKPIVWTPPSFDKPKLKLDYIAEGVLGRTLEKFATMPYGKLLDYVYYETEPMKNAQKGKTLLFDFVSKPEMFVDPVSLLDAQTFYKIQKRFKDQKFEDKGKDYILADEDVMLLCDELDSSEQNPLVNSDISISDQNIESIKELNES